MPPQVIGLVAHTGKPASQRLVAALQEAFRRRGREPLLERQTAVLVGSDDGWTVADLAERCDLIVVLGGDGTMLQVVHAMGSRLRPLFGINTGALGFLTCAGATDWEQAVAAIVAGNFVLSPRSQLEVEVVRSGTPVAQRAALNDVVIGRGEMSRLIRLDTLINGRPLTQYNADGLIIATPTGSTAYSLSAGGAILAPESDVLVITPICPHVLANRSLVVPDSVVIEVRPAGPAKKVVLTVDGQEMMELGAGETVRVRKAAQCVSLAMLPGVTFFEVLTQKLKWSGSAV